MLGYESLNSLRKEYVMLLQGGLEEIDNRIQNYEAEGTSIPYLDSKTFGFLIQFHMIDKKSEPHVYEKLQKKIWKYLEDRSFKCQILEYELRQIKKTRLLA